MARRLEANGFMVPPTPASTVSRSYRADSDLNSSTSGSGRSGRSLVEQARQRDMNLAANNVYMRALYEELPNELVRSVGKDRGSPGPSLDDIRQDVVLSELWMGTGEPEVGEYFKGAIFPKPGPRDSLKRSDRQPMAKYTIPGTRSALKISTPAPDMLYGYKTARHFSSNKPS
ncbi:hypothetical protein BR93DRAFT_964429 [Coniochaeta sp. PMI_546]|nr:hypothetical protein BR93DRAFT_964429 [Coniochaeta sp. PMI_546]